MIGQKGKSPKNIKTRSIDPVKIMAQATKLSQSGKLNSMKKLYGNDRGSFLHKQATPANKSNTIGRPC